MDNSVTHILTLSLVVVLSPYFSKIFKLPPAPIEIIIGAVLAFFGLLDSTLGDFSLIAHVGFLYLMFLAGLEVNLNAFLKFSKVYIMAAAYFLLILWGGAVLFGIFFHLNTIVIVSLPLISLGVLATLSNDYGKSADWIKVAFLVGTIGEVISIAALTVLEVSVSVGFGVELIQKFVLLVVFLGTVVALYYLFKVIFWWYPEFKSTLMPKEDGKYQDLRLSIGLFFIMIAIMKLLHLELVFGAFVAGLFISTFFHHKTILEDKMSSFGFGFLVPIFFIYVGASFDLQQLVDNKVLSSALVILLIMFGSRILASYTLSALLGQKKALLTGFSLAMPLTLMIAVATVGKDKNLIDAHDYYAMIFASLLEVIISMIIIKLMVKSLKVTQ